MFWNHLNCVLLHQCELRIVWRAKIIANFYMYLQMRRLKAILESSLFVGDQCSWLSWVSLAHEFKSTRTCIQAFVKNFFYKIEISTDETTSPRTRKVLSTHKYWSPRIKMSPQCITCLTNVYNKELFVIFHQAT